MHVGFVDDTLPGIQMQAMQQHLRACHRCARHDIAVRRGLMVVRSLPMLEPSPDFMERLNARLRETRLAGEGRLVGEGRYARTASAFGVLAAAVGLVAYLALTTSNLFAPTPLLRMPPVVATAPEPPSMPLANAALVAAVSTGMAVWPAVLIADQAPLRMTTAELSGAALR